MDRIQNIQTLERLLRDERLRLLADELEALTSARPTSIRIHFEVDPFSGLPAFTHLSGADQPLIRAERATQSPRLAGLLHDFTLACAGDPSEPLSFLIPQGECHFAVLS